MTTKKIKATTPGPDDRYDQAVCLRFTKAQKKRLLAKAREANMPPAIWARRIVCDNL